MPPYAHRYSVGVDIGSTATKVCVLEGACLADTFVIPTGWSGKDAAAQVLAHLRAVGATDDMRCIATGYGRVCVDYADKVVTEITCHGRGAAILFGPDGCVVDVGGQDTKVITLKDGVVADFIMNDKCAAGTGKFVEVMAARLGMGLDELYEAAAHGSVLPISSMCTVFAESEVISHIGAGERREDIAAGVIQSVASKVANLAARQRPQGTVFLTGGLSTSPYFISEFSRELKLPVRAHALGKFAGALGAASVALGSAEVELGEA